MPDLTALLHRIGVDEPPPPTIDGLRALQRAFVARVPWEALAAQLGEAEPLDVEGVATRILRDGRGGYCFELNAVFAWMLEELGFAVTRHEAVIGPRERPTPVPVNHLALVVRLDGALWLADVGIGEGPIEPVPLTAGEHRVPPDSPLFWLVEPLPDGGWWVGQHPFGSIHGLRIAAEAVDLSAFAPHHTRLSTSPDSRFVQVLVAQRPYADRIVCLRSRTLFVDGPAVRERRVLADADELAAVLRDEFAIDTTVLGAQRLERLWAQACTQHAARAPA